MTSIAWDGEILATDSRVTADGIIITDKQKKLFKIHLTQYNGDRLIAVATAGSCRDVRSVLDKLDGVEDVPDNHNVHALIVGENMVYELFPKKWNLIEYTRDTKLGAGSGEPIVVSAMHLGLNAIDAIKHAKKLDCYTGGKVQWLKL